MRDFVWTTSVLVSGKTKENCYNALSVKNLIILFKTALPPRTPVALAAINITPQHATCIIPCDASTAAASSTPAGADHTLNL